MKEINTDKLSGLLSDAFKCVEELKDIARGERGEKYRCNLMLECCTYWLAGYMLFRLNDDDKIKVFYENDFLHSTNVLIYRGMLTIEEMKKEGLETDIYDSLKEWVTSYDGLDIWLKKMT